MTEKMAAAALRPGESRGVNAVTEDANYTADADRETWPGYRPQCEAYTPYRKLEFLAAQARAKYRNVSPDIRRVAMAGHELEITTALFSTELGLNSDAVSVLKQGASVIHATASHYVGGPEVVRRPHVGFSRIVSFSFDLRRFKPSQLFFCHGRECHHHE